MGKEGKEYAIKGKSSTEAPFELFGRGRRGRGEREQRGEEERGGSPIALGAEIIIEEDFFISRCWQGR